MQLTGQLCQKLKDLFTLMKCNNGTIFWLLMQLYKVGTWIALVVKEHLLNFEMLQASVFSLLLCNTRT